ncbi:hypothetical protein CWR45_14385 [Oceanobacillus chungangensis]|uniref:Uncharacterized protein n=1 Tax=Oceanobacillus chungangensis TaxID=1229152 RepID=A0A3D8PL22_9BACI|nr:hypothetical protein CWR45_14385 [Oceanobacillus chungangensis]
MNYTETSGTEEVYVDLNSDITWEENFSQAIRSRNTLRFPRAAGEPACATALRSLTEAFPPAGVSVYFVRWDCAITIILQTILLIRYYISQDYANFPSLMVVDCNRGRETLA